ncbi:MAG: hypothetical protein NTU94_05325, partial [Planctomycetota bacterium]|nr:hypothetical protein [Planctomycetota bacterium]
MGAKAAPGHVFHRIDIGNLRPAELLGRLRRHLGRIAVDRLPPAQDDVDGRCGGDLADGAREDVAGGQGVAGGGAAVGEEDHVVGPAFQALAQDFAGL